MVSIKQTLSVYWQAGRIKQIRHKFFLTFLILIWFRLLAHLPAPGVNTALLRQFFSQNQFFALLDIFSGGTLVNFSVIALGLNPYINASVIFQLLAFVMPQIEELRKEGEYGQRKLNQYTRLLTVPLAFLQGLGMAFLLRSQHLLGELNLVQILLLALTMTAGTVILVFLGELINEYGLGHGVSIIILVGILARYPVAIFQALNSYSASNPTPFLFFLTLMVLLMAAIVFVDEAFLRVPINYARRISGGKVYGGQMSYLPLKVNTAGVMPIIFALSLVTIPSMISGVLRHLANPKLAQLGNLLGHWLQPNSLPYSVFYFLLVVVFTYFYTTVVFNPGEVADQLRKSGGFIPGVRPGAATKERLSFLLSRVTFIGAIFLGVVAVLPTLAQHLTHITTIAIGGTGILIVVSVLLEIHRLLENVVQTWNYDHYF